MYSGHAHPNTSTCGLSLPRDDRGLLPPRTRSESPRAARGASPRARRGGPRGRAARGRPDRRARRRARPRAVGRPALDRPRGRRRAALVRRLRPTAGVGGAALTLWAINKTGIGTKRAGRALLTFLSLLYGMFLLGIAISGAAIALGLGGGAGHVALAGGASLAAWIA